jgi:hypothetical protein
MLRLPRELETGLLTAANASTTFGRGIHVNKGLDFAALFWLFYFSVESRHVE